MAQFLADFAGASACRLSQDVAGLAGVSAACSLTGYADTLAAQFLGVSHQLMLVRFLHFPGAGTGAQERAQSPAWRIDRGLRWWVDDRSRGAALPPARGVASYASR